MSAVASASRGNAAATAAAVRRVLWVTLLLNLVVSGGKIAVGLVSGSVSMVADGYHSLVDGHLSLRAAHDVADRIEAALQAAHPQIVDVVVHLEPAD